MSTIINNNTVKEGVQTSAMLLGAMRDSMYKKQLVAEVMKRQEDEERRTKHRVRREMLPEKYAVLYDRIVTETVYNDSDAFHIAQWALLENMRPDEAFQRIADFSHKDAPAAFRAVVAELGLRNFHKLHGPKISTMARLGLSKSTITPSLAPQSKPAPKLNRRQRRARGIR